MSPLSPKYISRYVYNRSRVPYIREHIRSRGQPNAVFIWVPKTAGSSVFSLLGGPKLKSLDQVKYRFQQRGIVTFGHLDYAELVDRGYIDRDFDKSAFKFAFVRNPYDRAVSLLAYLKRRNRLPEEMTLLEFVRMLDSRGMEPIGLYNVKGLSQCNPQVRWLQNVCIDHLGRLESLDSDFRVIAEQLGIRANHIPHLNRTKRKSYLDYLCPESAALIESLYAEDFDAFGYPRLDRSMLAA